MSSSICRERHAPNPSGAEFCSECGIPLQPLKGRYHVIATVATRGVGTVFKAEDVACFNKIVAVKRFTPKSGNSQGCLEAKERCCHETEMLSVLNHHGIPKVCDYFSVNGIWYLVMDFIEGVTLEHRWETANAETRLSIDEIIKIGIELCEILNYLHQHRHPIIFTDLKPAHVILGDDRHVYLIDFGSAHYFQQGQSKGLNYMVTRYYAAPELDRGISSPRSDIYSLGAVLLQLVWGRKPLRSTEPTIKESQISPKLVQLIKTMWQENENDRPGSIMEVQRKLQEMEVELANPREPRRRVHRSRRALLVAGIAGGAFCLGGGIAIELFSSMQKKVVPPPVVQKKIIPFPLTIGSKLDHESELLSKMYILLLQNEGFLVTDRSRLGDSDLVFNDLKDGIIDIYPEFLQTGLARLNIPTTYDWQHDFQNVKDGFFKQYQITWLDLAPHLDDTFCVAMPQSSAARLGIKTLSDLARIMPQQSPPFKIAVAPNYQKTLARLKEVYGITFASGNVLPYDEPGTFDAVNQNFAQLSICYSTDVLIAKDNFVRLTDDKEKSPVNAPSPVIRNEILNMDKERSLIATTLNRLAPLLSSDVSIQLQQKVLNGQSAHDVAERWLKDKGLL
jgi:osmoprotectant transport system substrate-binding protein